MSQELDTLEEALSIIEGLHRQDEQLREALSAYRRELTALRQDKSRLIRRLNEAGLDVDSDPTQEARLPEAEEDTTSELALARRTAPASSAALDEARQEVSFLREEVGALEAQLAEMAERAELLREALRLQTAASMTTIEKLELTVASLEARLVEAEEGAVARAALDPRREFPLPEEAALPEGLTTQEGLEDLPTTLDGLGDDAQPTAAFDLSETDDDLR